MSLPSAIKLGSLLVRLAGSRSAPDTRRKACIFWWQPGGWEQARLGDAAATSQQESQHDCAKVRRDAPFISGLFCLLKARLAPGRIGDADWQARTGGRRDRSWSVRRPPVGVHVARACNGSFRWGGGTLHERVVPRTRRKDQPGKLDLVTTPPYTRGQTISGGPVRAAGYRRSR